MIGISTSANASTTSNWPTVGGVGGSNVTAFWKNSGSGVKLLFSSRYSKPTAKPSGPAGRSTSPLLSPDTTAETTCWVNWLRLVTGAVTNSLASSDA